ncbi:hypothetical protein EV360DRAFT_71333 [Lentinula raphanica]|nr:hypothetical protein EV360DRAFT_71333 [Lentinula raphanica]
MNDVSVLSILTFVLSLFSIFLNTIALFAAATAALVSSLHSRSSSSVNRPTTMVPLRSPARRLLATTILLSTFFCAIAAPLSPSVPGGGGNSTPTAPGNNATSVSGINAPPVPGNNAPPVSGANPPPGSETCKQVADLNLPSDKAFVFAISSVELPLDPEIEASKQPMRGDQFQLLFQNNANSKDEITFRLYLKAGNPCLVSGYPTSPAFEKDPEAADKKRPFI